MDEIIRKYSLHTLNMKEINSVISEAEKLVKQIPPTCPARRHVMLNLDAAKQIKREIMADINKMADEQLNFNWI